MRGKRFFAAGAIGFVFAALLIPPASAGEKTTLAYSIRDARAFLWQIHYPQSTFISEYYGPCDPKTDKYGCDRGAYNQTPNCGSDALGKTSEAPETPTPQEAADGVGPSDAAGTAAAWPRGNPVEVIHGLAMGRLGSSPESGGLASMYYVDQSGRRETEAHAESDGYVFNRHTYEERCAMVDAAFESAPMLPFPFAAHVLSRADQTPSTYDMTAFTTFEAPMTYPGTYPGRTSQSKESISIVKLWEADGKVHGVLTATVRGAHPADQITVDLVRSVISFSSDGTEQGLDAHAKTEAFGVTVFGTKLPSLQPGEVIPIPQENLAGTEVIGTSYLGVLQPVVQVSDHNREITIRAPGLFLAANTPLDQIPIPEDPVQNDPRTDALRNQICGALKQNVPPPVGDAFDPSTAPCRLTLGGRLISQQVIYLAGAILDAGVGRIPAFELPQIPSLPLPPPLPPLIGQIGTPPTSSTNVITIPPAARPVALPHFVTRELAGSAWTLAAITVFTMLGLIGVMGRWSMRYAWARKIAHVPPFPAFGWTYRAFLKG